MTTLNNPSFEANHNNDLTIADKLSIVITAFNKGHSIAVFTFKHTIVLSNKLHSEAVLMKYLNDSLLVRIC